MKKGAIYLIMLFLAFVIANCGEDFDDNPTSTSVNDFVWKGLNQYYYWLEQEPDLADNRFSNQNSYFQFINGFSTPESLFEHLLVERETDRFSVIFSDYTVLEQALSGTGKSNGVDYELRYLNSGSPEIFGWVRYIMPNSDASEKNIARGYIFYAVNNVPLTVENYQSLLSQNTYTLHFATLNGNTLTPNGESVTLTKTEFSENPVLISKVIERGSKRIGYLVYNGFYGSYETQLNNAFGYFKSENVSHLILDLRYNSGGLINTAARLASMITGQFSNQVFAKEKWNYKIENYYSDQPEALLNRFPTATANGTGINSLHLNTLYVITSRRTASASELVINGLKPYVNVVQIGTATTGKNVGSVTLYDSPTFTKRNLNPAHRYAMQPIVLKVANVLGFADYTNGLPPTVEQSEDIENLGELGETTDPLLATTLSYIETNGRILPPKFPKNNYPALERKTLEERFKEEMYIEIN